MKVDAAIVPTFVLNLSNTKFSNFAATTNMGSTAWLQVNVGDFH
jgi:hypothetical protein